MSEQFQRWNFLSVTQTANSGQVGGEVGGSGQGEGHVCQLMMVMEGLFFLTVSAVVLANCASVRDLCAAGSLANPCSHLPS